MEQYTRTHTGGGCECACTCAGAVDVGAYVGGSSTYLVQHLVAVGKL